MTRWRKSSRSQNTGTCVEIAHTLDQVRDSKNIAGPTLHANITQLISAIRAGRLG
jgi:uncharacterized protein DUF397